ncbi:MAG: helix-turn-helix domain-containing protein [Lachnospiraceae bacterium]|nr:helix-turn-helix domain-containing protein [Lachnospiraceae bacterium]
MYAHLSNAIENEITIEGPDYESIGRKMKELREQANLTRAALAKVLGYSSSHIGLIEKNSRNATIDLVFKYSVLFEVSLEYLMIDSAYQSHREELELLRSSVSEIDSKIDKLIVMLETNK